MGLFRNTCVALPLSLLPASESGGCHQFESASRLLLQCQQNSSLNNTSHVQRVIFLFGNLMASWMKLKIWTEGHILESPKMMIKFAP